MRVASNCMLAAEKTIFQEGDWLCFLRVRPIAGSASTLGGMKAVDQKEGTHPYQQVLF